MAKESCGQRNSFLTRVNGKGESWQANGLTHSSQRNVFGVGTNAFCDLAFPLIPLGFPHASPTHRCPCIE